MHTWSSASSNSTFNLSRSLSAIVISSTVFVFLFFIFATCIKELVK
jgi:hypothetical protein